MIRKCKEGQVCSLDISREELKALEQIKLDLNGLHQKWQSIFVWQDGPLVEAMRDGDLFLVDEISLADDSVLERLNSVLEPERMLVSLISLLSHLNLLLYAVLDLDFETFLFCGCSLWLRKEGLIWRRLLHIQIFLFLQQ